MYQLDFVCIPSFQHAIIAHFGCSLLTSKPSYTGEKVITEFRAKTFISMRHLRRKNVIGQNQKEPEPKLHTPLLLVSIPTIPLHFSQQSIHCLQQEITEFRAKTFISMRHLRRKNVIGQNQKEPEPKLHTPLLLVSIPTIRLHFSQQSIHGHKTNPN